MDLREAKVLVTGGSSGIGFETARMLKEAGAEVAICARHKEKLEKAAAEIGALAIQADVSKEEDVKRMVQTTVEAFNGYNVLINNAGYGIFAELAELDAQDFRDVLNVNTVGAMMAGRESALHFIEENYGNIINISSTAGTKGFPGGTAYCASKFALGAMTECWRAELRPHNIRVMQVNPSEVQTRFAENAGGEKRPFNETKLVAEDIAHTIVGMLSMHDRGFIPETSVWATNPQ